jgi:hypothetical protein
MFRIMVNSLLRNRHFRSNSKRCACIEVPVIFGKGAGTDFQADAMSNLEDLRGIPAIYMDAIATSSLLGISLRIIYHIVAAQGLAKRSMRR